MLFCLLHKSLLIWCMLKLKNQNKMQKKGASACVQGGFSTAEQATQSWMLKLSEWATQPLAGSWGHKYQAGGLNIGECRFDTLLIPKTSPQCRYTILLSPDVSVFRVPV